MQSPRINPDQTPVQSQARGMWRRAGKQVMNMIRFTTHEYAERVVKFNWDSDARNIFQL